MAGRHSGRQVYLLWVSGPSKRMLNPGGAQAVVETTVDGEVAAAAAASSLARATPHRAFGRLSRFGSTWIALTVWANAKQRVERQVHRQHRRC
jgi:hypothetical protein